MMKTEETKCGAPIWWSYDCPYYNDLGYCTGGGCPEGGYVDDEEDEI